MLKMIQKRVKKHKFLLLFILMSATLLGEAGCTRVEVSGNQIDFDRVDQISDGNTISDVISLMGSPNYTTNYGALEYIYISERLIHKPIFMPHLENLDMVIISFDGSNLVNNIEVKRGLDANSTIDSLDDKTIIEGNKLNPFKQIIGNIGKYNTSNKAPGIR